MANRGTPMSRVNPATMKGPGDFDPPEYGEGHECDECGAEMEADTYGDEYRCECGHTEGMPEDPRIADAEDRMAYGGDW